MKRKILMMTFRSSDNGNIVYGYHKDNQMKLQKCPEVVQDRLPEYITFKDIDGLLEKVRQLGYNELDMLDNRGQTLTYQHD